MGQGNPESADALFTRRSGIFVADKLSDQNKRQADGLHVYWVELRAEQGYRRFKKALEAFNIPHKDVSGDVDAAIDAIFTELFDEGKCP
jgi:hypothetical protein